jgi:hypothetical protein
MSNPSPPLQHLFRSSQVAGAKVELKSQGQNAQTHSFLGRLRERLTSFLPTTLRRRLGCLEGQRKFVFGLPGGGGLGLLMRRALFRQPPSLGLLTLDRLDACHRKDDGSPGFFRLRQLPSDVGLEIPSQLDLQLFVAVKRAVHDLPPPRSAATLRPA